MSIKRTIITAIVGLTLVAVVAPGVTQGVTIDELMAQIAALQAQLTGLSGTPAATTGTGNCAGVTFTRNLTVGATGSDVKCLQTILNSKGFVVSTSGAGSVGAETTYFGAKTLVAVKAYQVSLGYTPANQVGPMTRAALNAAIGTVPGTPGTVVPPTTGGLSVSVASDTPASTSVATGSSAKFTKLNLTAGSGAVTVSKLYVTRSGLSINSGVSNIKVIDAATGGYVGNIGSLNSDNKAIISFYPALTINAGTTRSFYLQGSVVTANVSAGQTIVLGIASAADVISNATSVVGTFPANGNAMSVVVLTVGTVTVSEDGTVSDITPNVGENDVVINQFKVAASSTENVTVETITAKRTGTASASDTANIELYDVTNNRTVATVSGWDVYDTAVFSNLNIVIEKGKTVRYKVMVDVIGGAGSSKTVNADIIDGTDTLVSVRGNSYGYYITPTIGGGFTGKGAADQTIANGSLNVSKSASTPATGKVAAGSDVVLGKFDFDAKGEDVKITQLIVTATAAALADSDIKSFSIYNAAGQLIAGPKDPTSLVVTFTDTFIVPVGVNTYTVKATIADSVAAGSTVLVKIDNNPNTNLVATGMRSNDTITANTAETAANTLTISGAALTVTTLASPASKSVPKGAADLIFATFSLDAGAAGEDIRVTSITVTDSLGGLAAAGDIDNAELWADLTSANSARGDVYETIISATKQPSAATQAYTMTPTLNVTKGTFVKVALVADLNTAAGTSTHKFSVTTGGVTANGATTGNALVDGTSTTYVTASAQTMTAATSGTLSVTKDTSSPASDIVLGSTTTTLGVFRLAETTNVENLDLDQISFQATNGTFASTLYFYNGTRLLGSIPGADSGTITFVDGTLTVPANGNVLITVKADVMDVDGTTRTNGSAMNFSLVGTSNVQTTGLLSGQTANSTATVASNDMTIYKSRPYFAKNAASPSGAIIPLADTLLAVFDIRADGAEDIYFGTGDFLKVNVDYTVADVATVLSQPSFTLKDSDGNTLDSSVQAAASWAAGATATTVNFPFSTSLTIAKGTTKQVYVYGSLTNFEDSGDSIKLSLAPTAANCTFGINGAGAYAEGDVIFKNTINANSLVKGQ